MHQHPADLHSGAGNDYLVSRGRAWFAFWMSFALMLFDYIDRQVVVSLFPQLKAAWGLSDKELGGLVSIIPIVVAIGGLPVALIADRVSRVKSIALMAGLWSLATIACTFTRSYSQLFAARAVVGLGETGYGSVGAALIASLFPKRLRSMLLGAFFAAASAGAVLGVLLGGLIADKWGWKSAFGVVGMPGLALALLYLLVPDYKTVTLTPKLEKAKRSAGSVIGHITTVMVNSPSLWWTCLGQAFQVIVVSTIWAWTPSYLNRVYGIAPAKAGVLASMVVLSGALGVFIWGFISDRVGMRRPRNKLILMSVLCIVTPLIFVAAFSGVVITEFQPQFLLILVGGFLMTCSVAPSADVVLDVVHPGVRSTGAAVLSLFQNLFGLAVGPFVGGAISDAWGLQTALMAMPAFGVLAALSFRLAARSYESDTCRLANVEPSVALPQETPVALQG